MYVSQRESPQSSVRICNGPLQGESLMIQRNLMRSAQIAVKPIFVIPSWARLLAHILRTYTPVRYFYLLFMSLHLGRLAHTPCLWASLQHLQVHWCLTWRHSSPREQWRKTTHSNLIRHYDFCLCRVPSHQEGNGLGPACNNASNWATLNNIFWNCWLLVLWTFLLSKCLQNPKFLAHCLAALDLISPSGQVT